MNLTTIRPAIITTYAGPSNTRGSRVTATTDKFALGSKRRSSYVGWDHAADSEENHRRAAAKLAESMSKEESCDWLAGGELIGAYITAGKYAWVIVKQST